MADPALRPVQPTVIDLTRDDCGKAAAVAPPRPAQPVCFAESRFLRRLRVTRLTPRDQASDGEANGSQLLSTSEAKAQYFLDSDDLARLPYESGGWGAGRLRLYTRASLFTAAVRKHGLSSFEAKRAAAAKRRAAKHKREREAAAAAAAATAALQSGAAPAAADAATAATARALQASLRSQVRKALSFSPGGGPANWRLELPGTTSAVFAHLCGRPGDAQLATFVKKGAYIDAPLSTGQLLGCTDADVERLTSEGWRGSGVLIHPGPDVLLKYKPATLLLAVHGSADFSGRF